MLAKFGLYLVTALFGVASSSFEGLKPDPVEANLQDNTPTFFSTDGGSLNAVNVSPLKKIMDAANGTDMGLYNHGLFEGDIFLREQQEKTAVSDPNALWPNGVIVFKISDDVGCPYSKQCLIIMAAMEEYHRKTCVRFKDWTGEEDFVEIFYNNQNRGACWSEVGRSRRRQRLSLGQQCWFLGIVLHELGHVVGFWHEMNRPDRDDHIVVHWDNILRGFASAFIKNSPSTVNTLGESFDTKSIMMYDEYAFSKDGKSPTIETKSKAIIGPLWRKYELSQRDIRRIHKLYECAGTNPKDGFPNHFKCDFTFHSCGFRNRGKHIWKWKFVRKNEAYMFASTNDSSQRSQLLSVNFYPFSGSNDSKSDGCFSFTYFLRSSSMQVSQEILTAVTDVGYGTTVKLWNSSNNGRWYSVQMNINITMPYRLIFEMNAEREKSSASIDNVEISNDKCELLRNDRNSKPEVTISEDDWILPDENFLFTNYTMMANYSATNNTDRV